MNYFEATLVQVTEIKISILDVFTEVLEGRVKVICENLIFSVFSGSLFSQ